MKKNSLYLIALLTTIFLFYQTFLGMAFKLYLSHTAHQAGYSLNYESINSDGQSFTLNHPEIKFGSSLGKLEAKNIHFTYRIHPFSREIDLDISLDNPQVELLQGDLNLESLLHHFTASSSWFKINGHLSNSNGVIKLGTQESPLTYNFSIDHSWGKLGAQGCYKIHECEKEETTLFELKFDAHEGHIFSSELNVAILADMMHALFPSTKDISLKSGSLDGHFEFKLDNWSFKEGKGNLLLKGVSMTHTKSRLCCEIGEMLLNANPEQSDLAALQFLEGKIYFTGEEDGFLRDFKGTVQWNQKEIALKSDGIWQAEGKNSYATLHILSDIQKSSSAIKLQLDHLDPVAFSTHVDLKAHSLLSENYSLNFLFKHVTEREFNFAQKVLDRIFPELNPLDYSSGTLNAEGTFEICENQLRYIHVHELDADQVKIQLKPWEMFLAVKHIDGSFSWDLASNKTIDALLNIRGGQIALTNPDFKLWNFTDIETTLNVQQGTLNPSSASVNLAGLEGKAEIYGKSQEDLIHIVLDGKLADLKPFISERFQKGIQGDLEKDTLHLQARIGKIASGIEVKGEAMTLSSQSADSPLLRFGFAIEKTQPLLSDASYKKWATVSSHLTDHLSSHAPAKQILPTLLMEESWKQEIGYAGFKLTKGWFQANDLPLNKFLSSFLFPNHQIDLHGVSSFVGTFNTTGFEIEYIAKDLILENDSFIIEVPLTSNSHHGFNFSSLNHFGFIPVSKGSYFDKSSGLLFTEMETLLLFENDKLYADHIQTYCQGLFLGGNIEIDYSNPAQCDIKLLANDLEGTFTQAQHFLGHFEKMNMIAEIPLEGSIGLGSEGIQVTFNIHPERCDFQANVDCFLMNGAMECPHADLFLREISFNVSYDHQSSQLALSDIQGLLLVGTPDNLEEFNIEGARVFFNHLEQKQATFELNLNQYGKNFGTISGVTQASIKSPRIMQFIFDLNSAHLGSFKPSQLELSLFDWDRVDHFKMSGDLHLTSFLQDLRKIAPAKISFLSDDLLEDLKNITPTKGEMTIHLNFEGETEILGFKIEGSQLSVSSLHFDDFLLKGTKRKERYTIDQFQLDKLSLSAELIEQPQGWDVSFLGLRMGEGILLGMDGQFNKKLEIQGHIHLFEVDLAKLPSWKIFESLEKRYALKGLLKGSGYVSLNRAKSKEWTLIADFETATKNLSLQNYPLQDSEKIKFHFASGEGWSVENIHTRLGFHDKKDPLDFNIQKILYSYDSNSYSLKNCTFSIPHERLVWLATCLDRCLPNTFNQQVLEGISHLKNEGYLRGSFSLDLLPQDLNLQLGLAEDQYCLFGTEHFLKECQIKIQHDELLFNTLYTLNQKAFWISSKFKVGMYDRGVVYFTDPVQENGAPEPLEVYWRNDKKEGFVIEKAEGHLAGLSFKLKENPDRPANAFTHHLIGTILVDGEKVRPLLPGMLEKAFSALKIGKGYLLDGEFDIGKQKEGEEEQDFRFFGILSGSEVELKGYRFKTLSAQVVFEPGLLQFLDTTLADAAGTFHMGNMQIYKSNENWYLHTPLLTAYDVRPSLLREVGLPDSQKRKPLVIRQFVLQDILGNLSDSNSFKGHGTLYFINPQKKNLQNTIFAIPGEILTRIGLNLSVLTPVSGTVHFELHKGKIHLTKFKDVYSDNKISKFYLPSSGAPSTIDLDGNMQVQVRFKQSTILLKLAELFTIQIQGTLQKPTYALQRQKYLIKEEVFSSTHENKENEVIP